MKLVATNVIEELVVGRRTLLFDDDLFIISCKEPS